MSLLEVGVLFRSFFFALSLLLPILPSLPILPLVSFRTHTPLCHCSRMCTVLCVYGAGFSDQYIC